MSTKKKKPSPSMARRIVRASATGQITRGELDELIGALGVIADPNASPEDQAAANDKLVAYFKTATLTSAIKTLTARVARAEKIAKSRATIRTLADRAEKIDAASAVLASDPVIAMIERARHNTTGRHRARKGGAAC